MSARLIRSTWLAAACACGAAWVMFEPSSVQAQSATGEAATQPAVALEEIIVTSRKRAETIQDAPAAVFAVTPQDMTNYGITDLVSAGDLVPGLQIARSTNNSAANIYLRGIGR